MNHLDFEEADEDLTVVIQSEDGVTWCEAKANSVLLKMLSPWWRTKLTSSGFKDSVNDSWCVIVHANPRVAEFALKAAKLRLQQADLVAEGDLGLAFSVWQLADMWQFGYLSSICQGALKDLLRNLSSETKILTFLTAALEHSDAVLEDVLVPFFLEHQSERKSKLYLAFNDRALFRLAEVAPIAGFQSDRLGKFQDRLNVYATECEEHELLQYLQRNPEARNKKLYSTCTVECSLVLFASAPLPFVSDMVRIALKSSWTPAEKELALSAIDYDRVTSYDQQYLRQHHLKLPQQAYLYRALWLCSQHNVKHPEATISQSPPWVIACCIDHYGGDYEVHVGPVKLQLRGVKQAVFFCSSPAYGVLYNCGEASGVVQPALPFKFGAQDSLIVYEAENVVIQRSVNLRV